ncbi:MAG: SRPBCC family protein [Solirubrobacterales bacterium]|nr:SRPBCC family protein [Solirubrobacterales bacterium]
MATITKTAEVSAASDTVWDKLTETESYPDWQTTHVSYPEGPPEISEGSTFKEKVTIMGMPGEVNWTVTKVDPGSGFELEGKGPMGTHLRSSYWIESNGEGCSLTFESEFGGAALAAMAGPLEKASDDALAKSIAQFTKLV